MYKEKEVMEFDTILKDEQEITMLICSPNVIDLQGDEYSEELISEIEANYNKYFKHFGIMHMDKNARYYDLKNSDLSQTWANSWDDSIKLLASYITSNDAVIGQNQQIPRGSWIMDVKIKDDALWQKIKNKELNSASLGGMASKLPANSHKQIVGGYISEISLVPRGANGKEFLLLKGIDLEPLLDKYPNFHSCSLRPVSAFQEGSLRNITSGRVQLIIGRLHGETTTTVQAVRYPIEKYDVDTARRHCQAKGGEFHQAKEEE